MGTSSTESKKTSSATLKRNFSMLMISAPQNLRVATGAELHPV